MRKPYSINAHIYMNNFQYDLKYLNIKLKHDSICFPLCTQRTVERKAGHRKSGLLLGGVFAVVAEDILK